MFAWLGGLVTRRAWWVVAVWVVAAVVVVLVAPSLASVSSSQTSLVPPSYQGKPGLDRAQPRASALQLP